MRHLIAAAPLFALVGCSYVNLTPGPTNRFAAPSAHPQPVSVRVGTPPEKTIEASEPPKEGSEAETAPAAEASASPATTQ